MTEQPFKPAAAPARTAYFDYLKVLGYISIIMVHAASYQWYTYDINSVSWLVLNFYKSTFRAPVLYFFMVSGAIMLERSIPLKKLYGKYVLRLVVCFIFWDIVYAVITYWNDGLQGIIFKFFNSNYHLWFLLAIIALYICMPLMKLIVQNKKVLKYFLVLSAIFAFILPTVFRLAAAFAGETGIGKLADFISGHIYDMHMDVVLGYPFFFLAGYYIHHNEIGKAARRILYVAAIAGILIGFLINTLFVRKMGMTDDTFESSFMIWEMVEAVGVFTFFKYNVKGNAVCNRFAQWICRMGLGVYVLHDLMLLGLNRFLGLNAMSFNPVIAVPAVALIAMVTALILSALLHLIPVVKKYIV